MTIRRRGCIVSGLLVLAGCTTADPLEGQRTVFNNPYAAQVLERTGIGPQGEVDPGRDATRLGAQLAYSGRGRFVLLASGQTERLRRNQDRILRERGELLEAAREALSAPPPLTDLMLPTAESGACF